MLNFMCMVFAELYATGSKRKIQNENIVPPREIEPATICCPTRHSNHSAIGPVEDVLLKLLVNFLRCYQPTRVTMHVRN